MRKWRICRCRKRAARVRYELTRRSDREAEGARLLSEYAPQGHLGFESLLLRHFACYAPNWGRFLLLSRRRRGVAGATGVQASAEARRSPREPRCDAAVAVSRHSAEPNRRFAPWARKLLSQTPTLVPFGVPQNAGLVPDSHKTPGQILPNQTLREPKWSYETENIHRLPERRVWFPGLAGGGMLGARRRVFDGKLASRRGTGSYRCQGQRRWVVAARRFLR